jgi:hypothetical protein
MTVDSFLKNSQIIYEVYFRQKRETRAYLDLARSHRLIEHNFDPANNSNSELLSIDQYYTGNQLVRIIFKEKIKYPS